jgi:hypothetical protein
LRYSASSHLFSQDPTPVSSISARKISVSRLTGAACAENLGCQLVGGNLLNFCANRQERVRKHNKEVGCWHANSMSTFALTPARR